MIASLAHGRATLWEPFSTRQEGPYRTERALNKSVYGNRVVFEEVNHELELVFRYSWAKSDAYGFVRQSELRNTAEPSEALRSMRHGPPASSPPRC